MSMAAIVATSATAQARPADSAAVMAVVRGFKAALAAGDSTKVISLLHSDLIVFEGRQAENLTEYGASCMFTGRESLRARGVVDGQRELGDRGDCP